MFQEWKELTVSEDNQRSGLHDNDIGNDSTSSVSIASTISTLPGASDITNDHNESIVDQND